MLVEFPYLGNKTYTFKPIKKLHQLKIFVCHLFILTNKFLIAILFLKKYRLE